MQPLSRRKRLYLYLAALIGALVMATLLMPWRQLAETMLRTGLKAQGLREVQLTVEGLGFNGIKLRDIALGADRPIILPKATIGYSLADLWHGRLQSLHLDGLSLSATQQDGAWHLDGFTRPSNAGKSTDSEIPVTMEQIAAVPLTDMAVTHGNLQLTATAWSLALPLELTWQKTPAPQLVCDSANPEIKFGTLTGTAEAAHATFTFAPEPQHWQGKWQIDALKLSGAALDIPPLTVNGTVDIEADMLRVAGNLVDPSKNWDAAFKIDINRKTPAESRLTLLRGSLLWNGGTISIRDVAFPLGRKTDVTMPVVVKAIPINAFMQQLTGKKATAEGVVSGTIMVTIKANGSVLVDQGQLTAEAPGIIAIDPDAIPGDNDQIVLVRQVLQNLHYTLLAIGIENNADNKPVASLTVEGKNPDAYNGRPVKLRVHLGGDVLEFVKQGLMSLTDPQQLLRQDGHGKNNHDKQ